MIGAVSHLVAAATSGAALANSAAAASLLPAAAVKTLQPSWWQYVPQEMSIEAAGRISNIVTTPGTLTFALKLGATVVAQSQAIALNTTAKTNVTWRLRWDLTLQSVGAAANLLHTGDWKSESVAGSAVGIASQVCIPASAPAVGANFDSTAALALDLTAQWSVADPGNSIQLQQFRLLSWNDIYG